ncbi:MAG: hypothetical protein IPM77_02880 [Crocinitomicaceae bacterium]|nr:hypothetical protein [Crocinitomicaceae bacterium]
MENLIQLNNQLIIRKVTYETHQAVVTAECELVRNNRRVRTSFLISHTDLNRILAKLIAKGYNLDSSFYQTIHFEDGTQIVDCQFDQLDGEPVVLEDFNFNDLVTEIRA